jgi:hypothetical protein
MGRASPKTLDRKAEAMFVCFAAGVFSEAGKVEVVIA